MQDVKMLCYGDFVKKKNYNKNPIISSLKLLKHDSEYETLSGIRTTVLNFIINLFANLVRLAFVQLVTLKA